LGEHAAADEIAHPPATAAPLSSSARQAAASFIWGWSMLAMAAVAMAWAGEKLPKLETTADAVRLAGAAPLCT
jgi:hypothetical protein